MTEVDFYKLERSVQDRFADATRSIGVPVPVLRVPPKDPSYLLWFVGSVVVMVGTSIGAWRGVGDLASSVALAPVWHLVAVVLGYAVGLLCLLRGLAGQRRFADKPYAPGLYLFPVGIIDARTEPFRVAALPQIQSVELDGNCVRVQVADEAPVSFPVDDGEMGNQVKAFMDEARRSYAHALETQSRRELALLDPLVDSGFSSPFSPKVRIQRRVPVWQKLSLPLALAAGGMLGAGLWVVRNRLSERLLYEKATTADSVEAYRAYLERGGARLDVKEILLPRAELRLAEHRGTVEAIEHYLSAHPASAIGGEVTQALHDALDAELAEVKAKGSVTALREFLEKRKSYSYIRKPTEQEVDALYRASLDRYLKAANPAHLDETRGFVERLLGYASAHGPEVRVRFFRRLPKSVESADSAVRRSSYFMGNASVPSQYFDDEDAARREKVILDAIVPGLQAPFPKDVLNFTVEEAIPNTAEDEEPPAPHVPRLLIRAEPHMSGGYMSRKPRGVFVGVGMKFNADFTIPGDPEVLTVRSSTWRTPDPRILKEEGKKVADVYEAMAAYGYERFERRLLSEFFKDAGGDEG